METLTGLPTMTIAVNDNNIAHVKYETATSVDILNATDGDIFVNTVNDFDNGTYFIIPERGGYNDFHIGAVVGAELYIKSASAGNISIVCRRY